MKDVVDPKAPLKRTYATDGMNATDDRPWIADLEEKIEELDEMLEELQKMEQKEKEEKEQKKKPRPDQSDGGDSK